MKIVLVAGDFAQSEVLSLLAASLEDAGHQVVRYLSFGKPDVHPQESVEEGLRGADWLVAGMSERSTEEVFAVRSAMRQGIRFALYADTFGAHRLPAFECARAVPLALFTVTESEASDAETLFPQAHVFVTGNPRWEEFFFPKTSRLAARTKLGIEDGKRVILCVGDKYLAQNMIQFGATIDAVQMLGWEKDTEIIFSLHPGDQLDPGLYDEVVTRSGCTARILDPSIRSGDILSGCDLVVEFTSTIGIQAAHLRIPVIDFCSTIAMRGRKARARVDPWKLAEHGASVPVYHGSSEGLANILNFIGKEGGDEYIRGRQEKMFPKPDSHEPGLAIQRMCLALASPPPLAAE